MAASTNTDKLKKVYDLYTSNGLIKTTDFDTFSKASEDQKKKLYDLGVKQGLFKSTDYGTFSTAWVKKKEQGVQPQQPTGGVSPSGSVPTQPISGSKPSPKYNWKTYNKKTEPEQGIFKSIRQAAVEGAAWLGAEELFEEEGVLNQDDINGLAEEAVKRAQSLKSFDKSFYNPDGKTVNKTFSKSYLNGNILPNIGYADNGYSLNRADQQKVQQRFDQMLSNMKAMTPAQTENITKNLNKAMYNAKVEDQKKMEVAEKKRNNATKQEIEATEKFYDNTKVEGAGKITPQEERLRQDLRMQGKSEEDIKTELEQQRQKVDFKYEDWFDQDVLALLSEQDKKDIQEYVANNPEIKTKYTYYATRSPESQAELITQAIKPRLDQALNGLKIYSDNQMIEKLGQLGELNKVLGVYDFELNLLKKQIENYSPKELAPEQKAQLEIDKNQFQIKDNEYTEAMKGFNGLKQQLAPVFDELGKLKPLADAGDQVAIKKYNGIYDSNKEFIEMYDAMIPKLEELLNARNLSAQALNKYATTQEDIASFNQYKQSVDKYNQIYEEVLPLYQKQQEIAQQLPNEDIEKIFQLYQDMNSTVSLSNELEKTKTPTIGQLITTSMQGNPLFSFHMATTFPFLKSAGEFTLKSASGIMRSTSDVLETLTMKPDDYYSGADFAADMIVKGSDLTGESWIRDVMPGYQMKDFYDINGNFVYSPLSLTVGAFEQLGVVAGAAIGTTMMGGASSNSAIIAPMFFATYDDNKELARQLGYSGKFESMTAGVLFSAIEGISELILPDVKLFQGDAKKQLFMTFLDNYQKGGKAVAIKSIAEAVGKEYGEELMVEFGKVIATAMTNAVGGNVQQYNVSGADLFQTFVFTALASGPLQGIKAVGTSTSSFNNSMKFEMAKDLKSSVDMIESYRRIGKINDVKAEQLKRELNVISAVQGQLPDDLSQAKRVVVSGLYAERSGLEQKMNDPNVTNEVKEGYKSAINKINSRISQVIVADDTEFNDAYNKELEAQTEEVVSEIKKQYPELSAPATTPAAEAAPTTETDRIRTQILDDIFKDSTAQNKADALEQRMNNAEEISMTEINDVLDGLYKQVEMVMDNYFDNEAGQQYAQALLDKIDKIKSYEFATNKETAVITERKAIQTARASLQETASVINLARAPRATATITSEDGTTGTYSIEVGPDGAVTFEQKGAEPIRIGNVNDVNKTASIVETVLNEQGLPQSVSFSITGEDGRKHTITVEAGKKLKPQQLLDLAINIRANELGTVDPADFDTAYEEVTRTITKPTTDAVQVETAGQVPVQPEAGTRQEMAEGKPQAEPQEVAKEGVKEEVAAPKKQSKADKLNELQNQLIRAKINSRIPNILKALQSVGVKIEIIEDPAEYDRIMRDEYGNNYISAGVYVAESGKIYLNPERMIATGEGVKILYHEATHPVLNIIRNTNKPLYDRMVRAMEQAEKASTGKNREAFNKLKKFGEAYEGIGYDESQVNDEKLTELLALIGNGDIDLTKLPKSFTDTVIDFLNQIAKFLGIKARLTPTSDIGALRQVAKDIKNSFDKGVDIGEFLGYDNKGNIDAKDLFVNEDGTPFNQMSLSNKFVDLMNGVVFEYIEDTEDFNKLKSEGLITDNKTLSDFNGDFVVLHLPDNAFTGKVYKDNELILDGKGGVYFPIRFNDKGYFWASTSNAAKSMVSILNESRNMNPDGKIRMALISTRPGKILSTPNASTGVMEILFSKGFDKRAKLKESQVVESYVETIKKANIEFVSMFEKTIIQKLKKIKGADNEKSRKTMEKNLADFKKKGPTKAPKLTKSMGVDQIKEIMNEFFSPDNSSFAEREAFNILVLDTIAEKVNAIDKKASERYGKKITIVANEVLSFLGMTKNAIRLKSTGGRLSSANLVQGFSDFMMEPMLKGEDKNKVYAILEVDSEVEAVSIGKEHGSYDYAVKPIDKKAKITLNILQDRLDWKDNVIDPETDELITSDRTSNVLPTYGVSPKPVKLSVSQMSLYTATIDGVDVELKGIDVDVVNGFYSPLEQEVFGSRQDRMQAMRWLDRFKGREEAKWTGLNDWLESQEGVVSKQDILDYMKENRVLISEVVKGVKTLTEDDMEVYDSEDYWIVIEKNTDKFFDRVSYKEAKTPEEAVQVALAFNKTEKDTSRYNRKDLKLEGISFDYREVLVTLPNRLIKAKMPKPIEIGSGKYKLVFDNGDALFGTYTKQEVEDVLRKRKEDKTGKYITEQETFKSSHFDEPNILVHLRMNERTDAEGNKVLFLEEIQSDWGQKGRREGFAQKEQKPKKLEELSRGQLIEMLAWNDPNGIYTDEDSRREGYEPMTKEEALGKVNELIRSEGDAFETERFLRQGSMVEGIPTAPFVMNTSDWVKLAMRVALKEAVKSGANSIAWTTGEQQNDRFDLSKTIDELFYQQLSDGKGNLIDRYYIRGTKNQTRLIEKDNLQASELEQYVGKEVAEKIINGETEGVLKGIDLKVGGKGMIDFYGNATKPGIVGQVASKLFRQEVGAVEVNGVEQPSVTVTPQMKAEVKRGLPQFSLMGTRMVVEKPNEPTLKAAGLTPADVEQWKKKNKVSQREGRVTGVQKSAQDLYEGKITIYQHIQNVRKEQPAKTYQAVPQLPTYKDVASSLAENQMETGVVGLNKGITQGTQVGARLDIPSFNNYGTNVVSIHEATGSGKAIGYGRTASLSNVKFKTSPSAALKVAMGESKGTWARMIGSWNNESDQSVVDRAKQAISSGEWIQIGINPFRHSWFYNRATGMPVMEAAEVLQVGNMVLARGARELNLNNVKDKAEFEETFKVKLKSGAIGQFSLMGERGVAKRLEGVDITVLENIEKPISESKFENKYVAQHKDLVGKREGNWDKNKENILKSGFRGGFNVNALPIYTGYEGNVIDQRYGNRKGDIIYILPKEGVIDGPNGYKTKEGYKPKLSDVFVIEYDKQPTYEAYRNNLKNPSYIASAYIQAKQDGSNPELVKAVEDAIGEPTTIVSKAQVAGIRPTTREDVEAALSRGDRVIATLEMDDEPIEITSMAMVDRIDLDTTVIIPDVKGKMKKAFPKGQMSIFAPRGMMNTAEVAKKQYPLHQALVQLGIDAYQNQGIRNYASFVTYAKQFDESINKNPYMERVWEDVTRIVNGKKPLIQSEQDYRDFLVKQNNVPVANAERLKKRNRIDMVTKGKEKLFDSRAELFKALSQSANRLWSIAANYVNVIGGMGAKAIYTADTLADGVFKGLKTKKEYLIGDQMQSESDIFNSMLIRIRVQEIQRKMQDKFDEFIKIQSGINEIESANKYIKQIEKDKNALEKKYVKLQNTNTPEAKSILDEINTLENDLITIKEIIRDQHGNLMLDDDGLYVVPSEYTDSRDNVKRYLDRNNMLVKDAAGNYSLGTYMFANNLNERTAFNELLQLQDAYPDLYEKLMQRADAYHMAFNTLLDMQLEAGLISQESYDEMVEYKYVPMRYIGYMIEEIVAGDDIKINSEQSKLIKRLKGGSEENIDMAFDEALKFQAYMVTRAIAKNNAMQKIYEAAKSENFQGPFYEPDVTGVDADGNFEYGNLPAGDAIIYFYMDGKKMALATSKEIASAFNGSNMPDLGMSDEALGWAMMTIPFRAVTTNLNPGFGLAQLILDIPQALLTNEAYSNITTGLPRILLRDLKLLTGKGLGELSKLLGIDMGFDKEWNELAMEAREYGGLITFTGMDNETMSITQAAEKAMDKKSNMLTNALAAYRNKVEQFGTTMETVTRLAVYRKMRNNLESEYKKANNGNAPTGEDLDNIRTQAAATSLNVLNYNRGGTLIKPLNRALAYLNVAFQVPYSVAQYAKKNPYQFSMKAMEVAAWPVVITMLGYLAMDDDDREKFLEIYNNYNEYEKANYWHILNPLWDGKDPEDMIIRIKKPTILLPLVNSTEVGVMHSITGGKTMSPKDYVKKQLPSDVNTMQPVGWQLLSSAPSINALMKYFGNYDVYRKTEIVKNEKQIFDFREGQTDPNIGKFYKYVATKTGYFDKNTGEYFESISPARMDAAVKSAFGNYETNISTAAPLMVVDYALSKISSDYANFKYPEQTDEVKSFMDKLWEGVGLKKRFLAKVPEVNPEIYKNMEDEKKKKNYFREEIRSRMDEIMNGNLSREQKREEIRNYYYNLKKTNTYYDAKDLERDLENAYKYVDNKNWLKDRPKWYRTFIFAPDTESKIMIFDVSTENMDREDKRQAFKDLYVKGFIKEGDDAWLKYVQKEFPKQGK